MTDCCVERASARTGEFDRVTARIDELDRHSGERGLTREEAAEEAALWARIARLQPSTLKGWQWLCRWLARAHENDWHPAAVKPLLRLVD